MICTPTLLDFPNNLFDLLFWMEEVWFIFQSIGTIFLHSELHIMCFYIIIIWLANSGLFAVLQSGFDGCSWSVGWLGILNSGTCSFVDIWNAKEPGLLNIFLPLVFNYVSACSCLVHWVFDSPPSNTWPTAKKKQTNRIKEPVHLWHYASFFPLVSSFHDIILWCLCFVSRRMPWRTLSRL